MARYRITNGAKKAVIEVSGRNEWTLDNLVRCGKAGCTPIDEPAPRWAAYVHKLRKLGVRIQTIRERHGGRFPGRHARYVLLSTVRQVRHDA